MCFYHSIISENMSLYPVDFLLFFHHIPYVIEMCLYIHSLISENVFLYPVESLLPFHQIPYSFFESGQRREFDGTKVENLLDIVTYFLKLGNLYRDRFFESSGPMDSLIVFRDRDTDSDSDSDYYSK